MNKVLTVARFELVSTLSRRSVLFVMFVLPVIILGIVSLLNRLAAPATGDGGISPAGPLPGIISDLVMGESETLLPAGLVDLSETIADLPADSVFQPYSDEEAAAAAVEAEEINNYYVIPADFPESQTIRLHSDSPIYPRRDFEEDQLYELLARSFLEEPQLAVRVLTPAEFEETNISPGRDEPAEDEFSSRFILGISVAMLFFVVALGSAGYLLQSLSKEKQNRVLEILLASVTPLQMLAGKVLGLGVMGFIQLAVWGGLALAIFGRNSAMFQNLPLPRLQPVEWLTIAAFYVCGYFLFASLFAGLGAIAPGPKESGQYTIFITMPAIIPVWFSNVFWTAPNSGLVVAMSIIPLLAPVAMPMRMVATTVPPAQLLLSLLLIVLTTVAVVWLVSRLFHGRVLLSGQSLSLRGLWQALRG